LKLSGCYEQNVRVESEQTNNIVSDLSQIETQQDNSRRIESDINWSRHPGWCGISLKNVENGDYRTAIINEIDIINRAKDSYTGGRISPNYASENSKDEARIGDIKSFYLLGEIDGYELYHLDVSRNEFIFRHAPLNRDSEKEWLHGIDDWLLGLSVSVTRLDAPPSYVAERFGKSVEAQQWIKNMIVTDNIVHFKGSGNDTNGYFIIVTDNVLWAFTVPEHLSDYDTLHDFAMQVIKTAELVDVVTHT
jgi:hypothetical protein